MLNVEALLSSLADVYKMASENFSSFQIPRYWHLNERDLWNGYLPKPINIQTPPEVRYLDPKKHTQKNLLLQP